MVTTIEKATKFDFNATRDGTLDKYSLISEVQVTLAHFMTMLKVFANSLKQNKELTHPKKNVMSSVTGGQAQTSASNPIKSAPAL
ncbi:hypothetical protein M427DRAFT_132916 [Gonapodya prolifera JEL478]|uniref:Uncharacterized protein n=1 Tax=Gonapodya prolifera (strain JEL478) TaxID=1344416 RepID=A0A139ANE3_GONPJ|nr:hypothetical protein M427DRAFT_132916 [Gonapodya prolifera JEL478]|eukprot:KXS18154.1 hypothetical protein M427DRAFT_132916 [Gonapodya prolifera JEL478]